MRKRPSDEFPVSYEYMVWQIKTGNRPGGGALSLHLDLEMCLYTRLEIEMCFFQKLPTWCDF